MSIKKNKQIHDSLSNNIPRDEINKSTNVGGNNIGIIITGDGNTIYVRNEHILLEDYDQSTRKDFNHIFPFDNKNIKDIYIEPSFKLRFYFTATFDYYKENNINKKFLEMMIEQIETKNYIYLIGKYGTGKSLLLKSIYNTIPSSYNKYFIEIKEIIDISHNKKIAIKNSEKTKIFIIDGLDEINIDNNKFSNVIEELIKISNHSNIKFIFSTRLYISSKDDIFLSLVGEYAELMNNDEIPFIEISYFNREQIKIWLEKYYPNDDRIELLLKDIEGVDKRLYSMCQIPIFLYQLSYYFYKEMIENIKREDIYKIYKTFIDTTIKGKFLGKHKALKNPNNYKKFLMKIARIVFKKNYKVNNFKKYTENINKQLENNIFKISQIEVEKIVYEMDVGINGEEIEKVNNAINCYFFEKVDYDFWIFSNINILLYLISEYYFDTIRQWLQSIDVKKNFELYLDKTIFEYLVQLMKDNKYHSLYNKLIKKIESLIDNQIRLTDFEYFLGILYISYDGKKQKFPIILNKLYAYSQNKYDVSYLHLLYSSFQFSKINNIEFNNINFSNFNYSHSNLYKVTFKKCIFSQDTIFDFIIFDDVSFDNCIFKKIKFKNIMNSNISFLNCILRDVYLENIENSNILVNDCNNQEVKLEFHNISKSVNIKLFNIKGQSIIIKKSNKTSFKFINITFNSINLVHSTIYLDQQNSKFRIKKEGNSKIINKKG